jgi:hypothetical protein
MYVFAAPAVDDPGNMTFGEGFIKEPSMAQLIKSS